MRNIDVVVYDVSIGTIFSDLEWSLKHDRPLIESGAWPI